MIWGKGRAITDKVVARVAALREQGLSKEDACKRVGITKGGLEKALSRRRRGAYCGFAERAEITTEAVRNAAADGIWDVASLYIALGTNPTAVSRAMTRDGLKERDLLDTAISYRLRLFPGFTRRQMEDDLRAEARARKRTRVALLAMERAAAAREQVREAA